MESFRNNQTTSRESTATKVNRDSSRDQKSQVVDAANDLLNEGKKLANEMYENGLNKLNEAEDQMKQYSDQIARKIQDNPLTSILIAGGIGFILSRLLRK